MHYDWAISLPGGPSDVDSNDDILHFMYDDGWRLIATFREDDSDPKEYFTYHAPGIGGYVSGDRFILRDKDADTDWTAASDGTLEERIYYVQNWRGDVVNLLTDASAQVESVRYSAYGVPFAMPAGDVDLDGDVNDGVNTDDTDQIQTWISGPTYDVRGDLDLDGDVDAADKTAALANAGDELGRNMLSRSAIVGGSSSATGNRLGYAGYVWDEVTTLDHVRYRVYNPRAGSWNRRDPLGYVDGPNLFAYLDPMTMIDPTGLAGVPSVACQGGRPCGAGGSISGELVPMDPDGTPRPYFLPPPPPPPPPFVPQCIPDDIPEDLFWQINGRCGNLYPNPMVGGCGDWERDRVKALVPVLLWPLAKNETQ